MVSALLRVIGYAWLLLTFLIWLSSLQHLAFLLIAPIISFGTQTTAGINKLATLDKLIPLSLFIILAIFTFKLDIFQFDFSGTEIGIPIWQQIKNTMLITLWVFIGIQGAMIVSARAQKRKDVGLATLLAVISVLSIIYSYPTLFRHRSQS